MTTMNISLPETLKAFIDDQVAARGYASASEYLRELIRHEQDRLRFRDLIAEGLDSGPAEDIEDRFFDDLRASASAPAAR
jgi:antitoxin ParD1/3/4